jgi:hypothetical protein
MAPKNLGSLAIYSATSDLTISQLSLDLNPRSALGWPDHRLSTSHCVALSPLGSDSLIRQSL